MKKLLPFIGAPVIALTPLLAMAQTDASAGDLKGITSLFENFIKFINETLIPLVFALALLVFFYGIFKYFILGGGDEGSREQGKSLMLWAIIGFVVMVSIWGIVNLISGGLFKNNQTPPTLPKSTNTTLN